MPFSCSFLGTLMLCDIHVPRFAATCGPTQQDLLSFVLPQLEILKDTTISSEPCTSNSNNGKPLTPTIPFTLASETVAASQVRVPVPVVPSDESETSVSTESEERKRAVRLVKTGARVQCSQLSRRLIL